jgi:TPR repeat protein
MLGLNQPASQPNSDQPSMDLLREKSFSGLDSFFEPEQPKAGAGRILLLLVLLAALGGAGWWVYTNYLNPTETQKPQVASLSPAAAPTDMSSTKSTPTAATPAPDASAGSTQPAASSAAAAPAATSPSLVPEGPSENANPPVVETKPELKPEPKPAPTVPASSARAASPKIPRENRMVAKREAIAPAAKTSPEPVATVGGDADFRKGEAYLYGRGMPENCDEAVKYLKAASAESNAKARSTFGTMYATGHCVARDLPTSYQWFAMALRLDPNNQILEEDLTAIWNQMTPPERQMAARTKQ